MSSQALPAPAKQLFRYLFEQASLGIAVEDLEGKLLLANPALCSMLGYTEEELCGMSCSQFASPEDSQDDWVLFQQLRAGVIDQYSLEKRYVRKGGAQLWGHLNVSLLKEGDGGPPLVFAFVEEITERKLAEQELARSNERFRLAVEAGKSVGWEWDTKSGRDSWFGDLQTMFGIPSDTFVGRVEDFYGHVHPEDRQMVAKAVSDARQSRKQYAAEFQIVRLDGTVRWVSAAGQFYYDSNGDAERMFGLATDITERKLAEERLREYEKAVEGSEEMIAVVDREYRYLIANRKFLTLRNMTKEQVLGRSAPEVLTKGVFEAVVKEKLDECFQGSVVRYEMKYTYPELGERDVFVSYFPIEGTTGIDRAACILQDITDRKRTEEALRKSEERFRLAAQAGKMYAYEWDVATDTVMRSEEHVNVLGFSDQAKQLTRQQLMARVHPDDRALFAGSVDQLTPENTTTHISYRVFRPDGSVVWLEKSAKGFFDEQGKLLRMIGMVADITERRQAEEALRESEERLRLAQQAARIGTFEWNIRTGVNTWTPELEAMYGLPPGGFGRTQTAFESLIHPDDRARVIELVNCALKTGQPTTGEWRVLWPDGSIHWIAGRWQVFMNESSDPSRMIGVNLDVTERKRTEEALLEVTRTLAAQALILQSREELLTIFVKTVPAGVAMLDRDMRYIQVSDRWCADYSVDSSQILGRSHYELFPDIPQRWKEMHRRALEGETLRADEDRWDREGGTAWVRWEIRPWRAPSGLVGGILIFVEDVTRRKQMEETISGVSGRLIEAQERERTRIARDLHDDICQQLALVSIELEQVQRKLPDSVSEHRSHVNALRKRIEDISTDVQTMSHELHSAKLSYLGIADAMKSFCREFGEHHKFEIEFESRDLPRQLPPDVSLCLFRVLQEALRNAAKHSGVKRFEVQLWGTSRDVHLTISDLGSGFDTESAMKGRGLGITSMQERLKLVKGELTITSQPKRGTTIHARVPLNPENQSARAAG